MPRKTYQKGSTFSLAIAIVILVFLKMVVFGNGPAFLPEATVAVQQQTQFPVQETAVKEKFGPPQIPSFAPPLELEMVAPLIPFKTYEDEMAALEPAWIKHAVATDVPMNQPRVVIIIDDMGMDRRHTKDIMDLPGPLTLAFLPYAGDLKEQTAYGHEKGHELMVHVPMEPMKESLDAGPSVLASGQAGEEFTRILKNDLDAFDGYVGINNHMGSKLTQDRAAMAQVMAEMKKRGLLFVDSRTINTSVAADEAKKTGIPFAVRDVFIDHEETYEAASDALEQVEKRALKNGLAIAIGHPKEKTIQALREWLPTLEGKGIYIIPVSAAVNIDAAPE